MEAIKGLTNDGDINLVFTVETPIGTKNACVEVTEEVGTRLIRAVEVRIGWITADIRRYYEVQRCFNCNEYGHRASNCPNEKIGKRCYNCGEEGHLGGGCRTPSRCATGAGRGKRLQP